MSVGISEVECCFDVLLHRQLLAGVEKLRVISDVLASTDKVTDLKSEDE